MQKGEWTDIIEKEVENFENVLERVSENEKRKFWYWKKIGKTGRTINYIRDKYMDMMYFLGFL